MNAHVTADVHGEIQPVEDATVSLDDHHVPTNSRGLATIRLPSRLTRATVRATAGAFIAASARSPG